MREIQNISVMIRHNIALKAINPDRIIYFDNLPDITGKARNRKKKIKSDQRL